MRKASIPSITALLIALAGAWPAGAKDPARPKGAPSGSPLPPPEAEPKVPAAPAQPAAAEAPGGEPRAFSPALILGKSAGYKRCHPFRADLHALVEPAPGGTPRALLADCPAVLEGRGLMALNVDGGKEDAWLVRFDPELKGKVFQSPMRIGAAIESVTWVHPELAVVASGKGRIDLIAVEGDGGLHAIGTLPDLHAGPVREIAHNPANLARFCSVSEDGGACLADLERAGGVQTLSLPGKGSSARWPSFNKGVQPSVTTEEGAFLLFDVRARPAESAAIKAAPDKAGLFSHDWCGENHVALGYEGGMMQHIDARSATRLLGSTQDPYLKVIGNVRFGQGLLVVSGIPDFTLWRYRPDDGSLAFVCHSTPGEAGPENPFFHSATLLDPGTLLDLEQPTGTLGRFEF